MNDAIIVALISAGATIIGQWLISRKQHESDKTDMEVRLKGIDDKLTQHNQYAERIGGLASDVNKMSNSIAKIETDIEWLKAR